MGPLLSCETAEAVILLYVGAAVVFLGDVRTQAEATTLQQTVRETER